MDVTMLSRIQFALTVGFHFVFVPLSIGLIIFTCIMETLYVRTGDPKYKTLTKFWGRLFTINFLLGVVTGVAMEFQFGTNWSRYSEFMGDIFGSPLAVEALMAFFLESTMLGVWIFGWNKLSKKMHLLAGWLIALGTHLSAVWIIVANGFMQNPVGYVLRNNRAELVNFWDVLFNPYAWYTYVHTLFACYAVGAFFVLAVSAYHLLRKRNVELMQICVKYGTVFAIIATLGNAVTGHYNGRNVALRQPVKLAAMEAQWETERGAGFSLIVVPDEKNERNAVQAITIPGLTSWLSYGSTDAEVLGLKDVPEELRPPVALTFWSFRLMVGLGILMLALAIAAWWHHRKGTLPDRPLLLRFLLWSIPLPYIATNLGWMTAEVGRQPWTVYGLITTADSVSPVAPADVAISLGLVVVFYAILVGLDAYLLVRYAKAGPEAYDERQVAVAD
ncbi:cytochrome ubiquinol oxidase subunit I [Symbiobacterium thermophilum]|uniref:Cytochrome D ubiquinol oxidase subunit I n=1 Tax=Symbiobacterium thermophilum (strain DSM 24528 / JCM 14929 / IAM 14863 / T) TaxID=292459 RepID=Q67RR6_SYMTH|nr:cytochrome ubiquinol oxidase subunit I [Symbiobacterium thermophilum]BAD39627.1 cytochrome D ubiquinol oxidase subunit I [Symbiobacterium thermophilum IAM 14863]